MKLNVKMLGVVLAAALIVLLFLSRTIYSYNLPVVTAVMPQTGNLNKIELTSGIVSFAREYDVYSDISGKIDTVLIKEGDYVKKGAPLLRMDFGTSQKDIGTELEKAELDTGTKLDEAGINEQKTSVEIAKLESNISNISRKIDELRAESYTADTSLEYELSQCIADIQKAAENYDKTKLLYDAGAVSFNDISKAEQELNSLRDKQSHIERKIAEQLSDKEDSRTSQLTDFENQLSAYLKDLDAKRLDLLNTQVQKEKLNSDFNYKEQELSDSLADYENNIVIYAKSDGVITSVSVNDGQYIGANQKLLSCGMENDFIVKCRVPLDNNFITTGDTCYLNNASHSVKGIVSYVKSLENAKEITVSIEGDDLSSGETFDLRFEKTSTSSYTLVPRGAVNQDSDGYFLSLIKRRNGILGKEFYAEKLRVYIGDSDNENVTIIKGITFPEPIAHISDKPFDEGETIKIKNESDFFEN